MNAQDKTREQLIEENAALRGRIAGLEAELARSRQAEADQRQINNSLPVLVATAGLDGYYKEVNPAFERILGWSEQESLSRPFLEFIHPDDRTAAIQTLARLKSGDQAVNFLDRNICKDGSYRWINWIVIPVAGRDIVFGIGQDVTEQKHAEASLRETERRLATVISNLPGAVYRCKADDDWTIEFLSEGYRSLTGYEPSRLIGQSGIRHSELIHPDDRQTEFDAMQQAVARKQHYQVEYRLRTALGEEKWVWEQGTGMFSESGELEAIEGFSTDITDRKRAEEELQELNEQLEQRVQERTAELTKANAQLLAEVQQRQQAEEKLAMFRRFTEAATQGFGMVDTNGRFVYVNPFWVRLFDAHTPEDVIGKPLSDYYPSEYVLRRETEILPALRRGEHWQGQQVLVLRDGRMVPTIHTIFPVCNDDGQLQYTAAVITDITELTQTQEALRQGHEELLRSQERFELAVRGAGVGIWDWDIRTGEVYYSPRWKTLFGYQENEIGEAFDDWARLLDPDERDKIIKLQEDFLAGSSAMITAEYRLRHKDGSYRWIAACAVVVRDEAGKAIRLVGSHGDITDRKKAEDALRQSEAKYRALVESSPDAVATCDMEGRITFASTQAARLHGVPHSEKLLGLQVTDLLVKEDRARFRKNVRRLIKEKLRRNDEYTAIRKDGTTFSVEISSAVIPDAAGNPEAMIGVYRDITARKQAEERLKREQHALRRMVLAGDHERRLITYELHDGTAQQILGAKMLFESQQPPKGRKSKAADAYRDGMAALIRAASEVRRVMNRLRTPVLDKFGLVAAIDDVASQLRSRPDVPEIEYRHDVKFKRLEPTLENTLFRIAQEAMTNACRHSKSEKMQVTLTQKGNDVILEVRDWGIGFDQDTVRENRFGLEGIRERCRIMGGKLTIKSKPDQGTVVRAKFPVIEAAAEKAS